MPQPTIASEVIAQLEAIALRVKPPRIARLHLPGTHPEPGDVSRDADFCAVELADGSFGLSYILLGHTLERLLRSHGTGVPLHGAQVLAVARRFGSTDPAERALALACINAMTDSVWKQVGYAPPPAGNSLGDFQLSQEDHLGMIGFFPPLVRQVQTWGARLSVVELDERAVQRQRLRFPQVFMTLERSALAHCNKVVGTSTMLLNDTLDAMLAAAASASSFAVIGPSAGLWPDALFARGVTLLGGTRVNDAIGFRSAMRSGQPWGSTARKFALSRTDWPGWRTLIA